MKLPKYLLPLILFIVILQAFSGFSRLKLFYPGQKQTTSVDCPFIDVSKLVIKQPTCNKRNGSITGLTVFSMGTRITYTWHDIDGNPVTNPETIANVPAGPYTTGHAVTLTNIPEGTYTLVVTDNSGCASAAISTPFVVTNVNGINIDDSQASVKNSNCNNNGSVTGIIVKGATSFIWFDVASNTVVSTSGTTADLLNAGPGEYRLKAASSSCETTSKLYFIVSTFQVPRVIDTSVWNPLCGADTGSTISLHLLIQKGQPPLKFYFLNSRGDRLFPGTINDQQLVRFIVAGNLDADIYHFVVEDGNNCRESLASIAVAPGVVAISKGKSTIKNDKCNQHLGAITPYITGLAYGPFTTFRWTDLSTGKVVGKNKSITRIGEGKYELAINLGRSCFARDTFTLVNASPSLVPPKTQGSTLCLPGIVNITVTNPDTAATFRLYASLTDSIPIDSNKNGIFYRKIEETTDFFVARVHGDCESDRTQVHEVVVASIKIPNAFTPNGDGVNDSWNIPGIEKFPGADVKIFSRNGQMLFHSINYPAAFDGTYKGSLVPPGVYYYIIDVKEPVCFGKISGSLTIIY